MKKLFPQKMLAVSSATLLVMLICGSGIRSDATIVPLTKPKSIDVNVVVHGNVGLSQADIEELAENLLEEAKLKVVDSGDGPDVLEVTVIIEADDDDDDDDGIPDAKDDDDDGDGEKDEGDADGDNDGKGFHITIEVEGGWHVDGDCADSGSIDDELNDIFDEVIEHIEDIE